MTDERIKRLDEIGFEWAPKFGAYKLQYQRATV
jgi:hypothetical protein